MAFRDGSGPNGQGSMTGRGLGACSGVNAPFSGRGGAGLGRGRGAGRGFVQGRGQGLRGGFGFAGVNNKDVLESQREAAKAQLAAIESQIKNLSEEK
ncbi:MAG: DUF5320 domain-containing protein [Spirochaetales bacterium]|nr:DUF5320 domain-containing protein [Spirochaetales bacterium]